MIWKIFQEQGKLGLEYYKTPDCKVCKVFSCRNYDRVRTVFVTGGDVQPFIYKLRITFPYAKSSPNTVTSEDFSRRYNNVVPSEGYSISAVMISAATYLLPFPGTLKY